MKYFLECVDCGKIHENESFRYLCSHCSKDNRKDSPPRGVLKTIYKYREIRDKFKAKNLFQRLQKRGFLDLLPMTSLENLTYLKVGNTPLYRQKIPEDKYAAHELCFKDDSQNPTFSFKDRASSIVCAFARENRIFDIVTASTGNAGSSLAGIGASLGLNTIIIVPETAPSAKLMQIAMYGAKIIKVQGSYDDAFELSLALTQELDIFNRNTAYNPFTIEGKKTAAFEIFGQLGKKVPDRIFVPVGDGCIISGMYKGWEDLLKLGIIEYMPEIIAVQAEKSSNLINNLGSDEFAGETPQTAADSISVKVPRNFYMTQDYLTRYQGNYILVSDSKIMEAAKKLAEGYGLFSEPAAAAAYAGYLKFRNIGEVKEGSCNVVLLTGCGLKDIGAYIGNISIPAAIAPDPEKLKSFIKEGQR